MHKLTKKEVLILLLSGVFLAGDIALWNLSFSYTSVTNANLLTNLTPFTVIPVSFFLFREKIPKFFLTGSFLTLIGIVVLIGGTVWGVAGMFLSIPLIAIAKVIFDRVDALEPFGYLIGDDMSDEEAIEIKSGSKKQTLKTKNQTD